MKANARVRHNIVANFLGRIWTSLMSLAFVPIYVEIMGVEVYGLIGIFVSIGAILSLLDMGLSATLSRELPRLSTRNDCAQEARNLVRTFEVIYWATGVAIGAGVVIISSFITKYWISSGGVATETVEHALMIMGLLIAVQWPGSLYASGLLGLQKQIPLNVIRASMATLQHGGAILILLFISPSIIAFFLWQSVIGLLATILLGIWLWRSLDKSNVVANFDIGLLLKNWRFAAGMTGISLVTVLLTQVDKIVLSRMLALEVFGCYMLAFNIANAINNFAFPIYSSLFPRFTQMVAVGDLKGAANLYHEGTRLMSLLMFPVVVTIAVFSREFLVLWIRDPLVADNVHPVLSLLAIGTALSALMVMPYALQLANGWTRFSIFKNIIALVFLVPLLLILIDAYQGVGAAFVWLVLNIGYLVVEVPIMHRSLLKDEMWAWYGRDIALPLVVVVTVVLLFHMTMPSEPSRFVAVSWIMMALISSFAASALGMGYCRSRAIKRAIL